jgi:broad specificity phosphatase PhoE
MRIVLVRHAEPHRGTGDKTLEDYGLTEVGREQVESLSRRLNFPIDQIVTSSLPRAIETGGIIAKNLGHEEPEVIDELCEIGERGAFVPETLESFFLRVKKVMNFLASRERQQTVLVVTHAGFIMGSIRALFEIPTPGTGARLEPNYTSLTEWHKHDGIWELSYFNLHGAK